MLSHVLAVVLALAALVCGYLAVELFATADIGVGVLLGSFGLLLAVLAVALFRGSRAHRGRPPATPFVPHWFLMAALALTALLIMAAILLLPLRS